MPSAFQRAKPERRFELLGLDGDGLLSAGEMQKAVREFCTGDDPQVPGNLIFGPLPIPAPARIGSTGRGAATKGAVKNGAVKDGAVGDNGVTAKTGPSKRPVKKNAAANCARQ